MAEYFDWLEQEAEEQRREERAERAARFLAEFNSAFMARWDRAEAERDAGDADETLFNRLR